MQNSTNVQNCAKVLKDTLGNKIEQPKLGLILGTGLGGVADMMNNPAIVPFSALPDFPLSGVDSHAGRFIVGEVFGVPLIIQQGRCHIYEGYSPTEVCMGTRVMKTLGIETLIITNAAGALNPQFEAGSVMVITDHINFSGHSPLTGPNDNLAGPRFPDMSTAYDPELITIADNAALDAGIRLEKGVYVGLAGPQLETPAETRMFRTLGADAVGMSTVLEVIAARHMGLRVLGFSCLTNKNLPDCMAETSLDEIIRVANLAGERLTAVISRLLRAF